MRMFVHMSVYVCVRYMRQAYAESRIPRPSTPIRHLLPRLHRTFRFSCVILEDTRARIRLRESNLCMQTLDYVSVHGKESQTEIRASRSRKGSADRSRTDPYESPYPCLDHVTKSR